jgi:hypothetical protein
MELEVKAKPYVGRYPFVPLEEMTTREWGWITEHTGYMPLQVEDALAGGDPRLVTMLAVVALARAGKVANADVAQVYDRLSDQPAFSTVDFITDPVEEGADADPPPQEIDASSRSSGANSSTGSDSPAAAPNGTGTPLSGSSPLPPVRSGI